MKQQRKTLAQTPAAKTTQTAKPIQPAGLQLRRKLFVVQQPPRWTRDS